MSKLIPVRCVQDDSGHWFVIPLELAPEFHQLNNEMDSYNQTVFERAEEILNDKFSKYRTGGDLNNIQLYAEI